MIPICIASYCRPSRNSPFNMGHKEHQPEVASSRYQCGSAGYQGMRKCGPIVQDQPNVSCLEPCALGYE